MTDAVLELDGATIDSFLRSATLPVAVDFWAGWCGPCRLMAPALTAIATDLADRMHVVKIDIEANVEACARYDVLSLPTVIVFVGGKEQTRLVGMMGRSQLEARFQAYLD